MFRGNLLFFISCVAVVTAFECGQRVAPTRHKRIANGYQAGHYPWTVLIRYDHDKDGLFDQHCGGSVIGSRWVLTASHCLRYKSPNSIRMTIGEADVRDINYKNTMVHRNAVSFVRFDDLYGIVGLKRPEALVGGYLNDIAVIELDQPLDFTEHIRPICLSSSVDPIYEKGAELVAIGHGDTRPFDAPSGSTVADENLLQEVKFIADVPAECKKRIGKALGVEKMFSLLLAGELTPLLNEKIRLNICMKEKGKTEGTCKGDSGGPLMLKAEDERWFQFGINSHGTTNKCGDPESVEVFASVAVHCPLISVATKGEVTCIDVKA